MPLDTSSSKVQFQKDKWRGIAAIAAVCSSIAAFATVCLLFINLVQERKTHRPYIVIREAGIKKLPDDKINIFITYINTGDVPAKGFGGRILFINTEFDRKSEREWALSTANDIPPDIPIDWTLPQVRMPMETEPYYIYVELHYQNPITGEIYSHQTYMTGLGVKAGIIRTSFNLATSAEADSIDKYLSKP